MEATLQTKTKDILDHHLAAFMNADIDEIMKDYSEQSEILSPQGVIRGLAAIRSFFEQTFIGFPKGSTLTLQQQEVREHFAYIAWSGESSFASVPIGSDTFIVEEGKIIYQMIAAHIVLKQ